MVAGAVAGEGFEDVGTAFAGFGVGVDDGAASYACADGEGDPVEGGGGCACGGEGEGLVLPGFFDVGFGGFDEEVSAESAVFSNEVGGVGAEAVLEVVEGGGADEGEGVAVDEVVVGGVGEGDGGVEVVGEVLVDGVVIVGEVFGAAPVVVGCGGVGGWGDGVGQVAGDVDGEVDSGGGLGEVGGDGVEFGVVDGAEYGVGGGVDECPAAVVLYAGGGDVGDGLGLVAGIDASGVLAGVVSLFNVTGSSAEVGFWLAPGSRGKGFLTEALGMVVGFALDPQGLGLDRVTWKALADNSRSEAIARRVGFTGFRTQEETAQGRPAADGSVPLLDERVAELTRERWAELGFPAL